MARPLVTDARMPCMSSLALPLCCPWKPPSSTSLLNGVPRTCTSQQFWQTGCPCLTCLPHAEFWLHAPPSTSGQQKLMLQSQTLNCKVGTAQYPGPPTRNTASRPPMGSLSFCSAPAEVRFAPVLLAPRWELLAWSGPLRPWKIFLIS